MLADAVMQKFAPFAVMAADAARQTMGAARLAVSSNAQVSQLWGQHTETLAP